MKSPEPSFLVPNLPRPFTPLPDSFHTRGALEVASQLLGKGLLRTVGRHQALAMVVEVEAYLGAEDPASHAHRKVTPRNRVMFERGGACYVYLSYGMCFCMNLVTGEQGQGQAVLFRAAQPISGQDWMAKNRGLPRGVDARKLLSGPGKLCQALQVDLSFCGHRFDQPGLELVDLGVRFPESEIARSPRIGISKAKESPYRFFVRDSAYLSRKAPRVF